MPLLTRTGFYRGVTLARRRRRVVYGVYHDPMEFQYEQQKNRIQISKTQSYEEYYNKYAELSKEERTNEIEAPTVRETFERSTTYMPTLNNKNLAKRRIIRQQAVAVTQKKEKKKIIKNPIVTDQGQEGRTRSVQYIDNEGKVYYKKGGTPAWRHNNPGNLSYSSLEVAKKHGAIDVVLDRNKYGKIIHRWGVFPTQEAGEKAMRGLLKENRVSNDPSTGKKRTIAEAIGKIYAPASDNNNVSAYANFVQKHSGIDVYNKSVSDLSSEEFNKLIEAIKARESSVKGEIVYPDQQQK